MFTSFSTALSALDADSTAIDVVGNNLANLNTSGFKASTVAFHDLVSESIGSEATQVGLGVGTPTTLRDFAQGALETTGGPLDAAIQGDGFFIVQTPGGVQEFTRGGNFEVDTNGNLTMPTGEAVQGWSVSGGVLNTTAPIGSIVIPVGSLAPPVPTTTTSVDLNLNASATAGPPPDTFSTSVQVYDSLGASHVLTFTFTKTSTANQWNFSASIPPGDTTSPSTPVTGTLIFDSNGHLTSPASTDPQPVISAPGLADGASDLNITWNLYDGTTPRITQFAQASATSAVAQNGNAAANLVGVAISDNGRVVARYSTGQQVVVGEMAMATIRNPETLIANGNNTFVTSALTALPAIGVPATGGRGTVIGGSVESSTADIAREFTNLIIFQRSYQANARVVTTVDQLTQDTINLKT